MKKLLLTIAFLLQATPALSATSQSRVVNLDFYILSKNGVSVVAPSVVDQQISHLNRWYEGVVTFKKRKVKILTAQDSKFCTGNARKVNPEDYLEFTDPNTDQFNLQTLRSCFSNLANSGISIFIARNVSRVGFVENIFTPLNYSSLLNASTVVLGHNSGIGLFFGFTLAHEIGHIMGLRHTTFTADDLDATPAAIANRYFWHNYTIDACKKTFRYPSFYSDNKIFASVSPLHKDYPGFNNLMGTASLRALAGVSVFNGRYGPIFKQQIDCWFEMNNNPSKYEASLVVQSKAAAPAAVAWDNKNRFVFYRGQDNAVWMIRQIDGRWRTPSSLGAVSISGPTAVSRKNGIVDVFVQDRNLSYLHKSFADGKWSDWKSIGGRFYSAPSAVSWSGDRIDVFGVGRDKAIWQCSFVFGQWRRCNAIIGTATAAQRIGTSTRGVGQIDLVYRSNILTGPYKMKSFSVNNGWSPEQTIDGNFFTPPSVVNKTIDQLEIFGEDLFNNTWKGSFNNAVWHWNRIDRGFTSGVSAIRVGNSTELYGRGNDGAIWVNTISATGEFSGLQRIGGMASVNVD